MSLGGRGFAERLQAEHALGRAEERVVVEERRGRGAGGRARADDERRDLAADVGQIGGAVV
jgi:hypothetical protein